MGIEGIISSFSSEFRYIYETFQKGAVIPRTGSELVYDASVSAFSREVIRLESLGITITPESIPYGYALFLNGFSAPEHASKSSPDYDKVLTFVVPYVMLQRQEHEMHEFSLVRNAWFASGGRAIEGVDFIEALFAGARIVTGGDVVYSSIWGRIDPSRLNGGLQAYYGPRAQVWLMRDIAIVTDNFNIHPQNFAHLFSRRISSDAYKPFLTQMDWHSLPINWRRSVYLALLFERPGFLEKFRGRSGYDRFTENFFSSGDTVTSWVVAEALLTADEFAALDWGEIRYPTVRRQETRREIFGSKRYIGREGRKSFIVDFMSVLPSSIRSAFETSYDIAASFLDERVLRKWGWIKGDSLSDAEIEELRLRMTPNRRSGGSSGGASGPSAPPVSSVQPVAGIPPAPVAPLEITGFEPSGETSTARTAARPGGSGTTSQGPATYHAPWMGMLPTMQIGALSATTTIPFLGMNFTAPMMPF